MLTTQTVVEVINAKTCPGMTQEAWGRFAVINIFDQVSERSPLGRGCADALSLDLSDVRR